MDNRPLESYRREFPVTGTCIYLDHAGVAPISLRVKAAADRYLMESAERGAFYYPEWMQRVASARNVCAKLINCDADEIAFVKSTSHGLSIVAHGLDWRPGDNVIIYEREFPSNIYPWLNLEKRGVKVRVIPSREGRILFKDIENLIDARTRLISLSSVQFTNGFRLDLKRVGEVCRKNRILFCVDAIQSVGIIPMDVRDCGIDFLSADAHKWLMGPEGVGIFFCRKELAEKITPPLIGWKSVRADLAFEKPDFCLKNDALRFEEGSMNLMGIFGLEAAVALLLEAGIPNVHERVQGLGDRIISQAEEQGFRVLTPKNRVERGGSITFSGNFNPEAVRESLRKKQIIVNCRSGGLRVSPHFYNTEEESERFFSALAKVV